MTTSLCTIIIPVGSEHEKLVADAITSAEAQTVPCVVIVEADAQRTGAGATRNRAVARANSDFLVFLDADDRLAPDFVERCAKAYLPNTYVYSDFIVHRLGGGIERYDTPDCNQVSIWQTGQFHLNTVFIPKVMHDAVGGYDEYLPAMEDTDYFLKLHAHGWCGVRVPEPLVTYRANLGKRSDYLRDNKDNQDRIEAELKQRYRRYVDVSCGCGQTTVVNNSPKNEWFEGAILARAQYAPMKKVGTATGRVYDRAGNGETLYVHAQDVAAKPDWWEAVNVPQPLATPAVEEVRAAALAALREKMGA